MKDNLLVSEHFYSVQCEGISSGVPSYFIRLTHCNLNCGSSTKFLNDLRKQVNLPAPASFKGDLHENGNATWSCDTIPVWIRGDNVSFDSIIKGWEDQYLYEHIVNGNIHIIWTGGEPTLQITQKSITEFLQHFKDYHSEKKIDHLKNRQERFPLTDIWSAKTFFPFNEIETNGTGYIGDNLFNQLSQINCSAKLSNSGMEEKRRIIPEAIKRIMSHRNYQFKFVVSTEEDIKEMFESYVKPFDIPLKNLVCMPGLDNRNDFHERTRFILEMAKKYKFTGLTRLHISAWDKACSV